MMEFKEFDKIARLSRNCVVTEKIDGTNASITITDEGLFLLGSRTRWITTTDDNFGFAKWAAANEEELRKLGPGTHYGEWWGLGIQRSYGLKEKRFSLFNTARWSDDAVRPACCSVVPVLYSGVFRTGHIDMALEVLHSDGSVAAPGFMKPEGVVIWHEAARTYFKKTIEKDEAPKSKT
jgi:hypothetical protein